VNVHGFIAFISIEKENIAFQSENFWHEVKAYFAGFGQA
jgi:hypothetical protein